MKDSKFTNISHELDAKLREHFSEVFNQEKEADRAKSALGTRELFREWQTANRWVARCEDMELAAKTVLREIEMRMAKAKLDTD